VAGDEAASPQVTPSTKRCYGLNLRRFADLAGVRPSSGARLPGIEGLRAVAACTILVWHSWLYSSPSGTPVHYSLLFPVMPDFQFGVALFFALSGFLLYRPFAASVLRGQARVPTGDYLRNRALRILPCYWFVLFVAAVVLGTTFVRDGLYLVPGRLDIEQLIVTGALAQNYVPRTLGIGIGPAWSLAVEVVFYLLLPALGFVAYALVRRTAALRERRVVAALTPAGILLLLGLSGKLVAGTVVTGVPSQWGTTWHSVIELSFWGMADLFAFGMAVAVLYVEVEDRRVRLPRRWRPAAATAAVVGYASVAVLTSGEQMSYRPSNTVIAAVCALLLALVVLPTAANDEQPLLLRTLERPAFVAVGVVSYGVFLWQVPIVHFLHEHELVLAGFGGFIVNTLVLFTVTLALSVLTYRYVEAPALRLKSRLRGVPRATASVPVHQESAAP
jgi:peptidoglycan/LPS O-acetylase OafA/YrhL